MIVIKKATGPAILECDPMENTIILKLLKVDRKREEERAEENQKTLKMFRMLNWMSLLKMSFYMQPCAVWLSKTMMKS